VLPSLAGRHFFIANMKTLCALFLVIVSVAVCGCNPDHSSDVRAPIPASEITPAPKINGGGANNNIPQSAKDALKHSVPGMGG